jgi:hypothetical protein
VGYTFKKDVEEQKVNLVKVLNESLQTELPGAAESDLSPQNEVTQVSSSSGRT